MPKKEPKTRLCAIAGIIGALFCIILSVIIIYFIIINKFSEFVNILNGTIIVIASLGTVFISLTKIYHENQPFFLKAFIGAISCFVLGLVSIICITYNQFLKIPIILQVLAIVIASSGAIYISRIKIKIIKESFFSVTLLGGFFCLILSLTGIFFTLITTYEKWTTFLISLSLFFAGIAILYVSIKKLHLWLRNKSINQLS